jgi:hypothetical protein
MSTSFNHDLRVPDFWKIPDIVTFDVDKVKTLEEMFLEQVARDDLPPEYLTPDVKLAEHIKEGIKLGKMPSGLAEIDNYFAKPAVPDIMKDSEGIYSRIKKIENPGSLKVIAWRLLDQWHMTSPSQRMNKTLHQLSQESVNAGRYLNSIYERIDKTREYRTQLRKHCYDAATLYFTCRNLEDEFKAEHQRAVDSKVDEPSCLNKNIDNVEYLKKRAASKFLIYRKRADYADSEMHLLRTCIHQLEDFKNKLDLKICNLTTIFTPNQVSPGPIKSIEDYSRNMNAAYEAACTPVTGSIGKA